MSGSFRLVAKGLLPGARLLRKAVSSVIFISVPMGSPVISTPMAGSWEPPHMETLMFFPVVDLIFNLVCFLDPAYLLDFVHLTAEGGKILEEIRVGFAYRLSASDDDRLRAAA